VSKREITIDELPAPGEPLKEKIAEINQEILDEEIRERAARIQSKLPRRELRRLNARYNQLAKKLNRGNYNPLLIERYELLQTCERIKHEMKSARGKRCEALRVELEKTVQQGFAINRKIAPLKPLVEEFAMIADRLKAHREVIEWEKKEAEDFANFRREAMVWLEQIKSVCRQNGRLNFSGTDSKGKRFCDIPIVERVIIKDDRVLYQIKTSSQGLIERFFGKWHSALPYDVDVTDLTCDETLANLSAGCKRVVTVERSQNGVNLFWCISRMDSPDGIPKKVLYSKVIDWYPIEDHRKTPWAAGVTGDRKIQWFNFEEHPHVLIAGASGGGKSTHLNGMIATLASMNRPQELRMVMVDLKGGVELSHWSGLKHLMGNIVKTPSGILDALQAVREVMENRLQIFESVRAKNLSSYNAKVSDPMPRIVMFIDEMATLIGLGELTTDIHNELRVLSSQGRAAGIHLVLATQHPSVDVLPGWIKTNMNIRIASKMPSHTASQIILDTISAALLPVIPGRMVFSIGREEIVAQSPYISDMEIAQAVRLAEGFGDPDDELIEEQPAALKPEFSEYDCIEIALNQLNNKLSPTGIHKLVGNEVASERKIRQMVDRITEQKQIMHNGITYTFKKDRKSFVLVPAGRIGEWDGDESAGSGTEIRPIEHPIKELEALSA
jgi:hypothetical protein